MKTTMKETLLIYCWGVILTLGLITVIIIAVEAIFE